MISIQLAEELNKIISESSGGSSGIRDEKLLSSALSRPFQTFDGKELYPSAIDKSAAIFQSIVLNHPFLDGNKRMGYVLMRLLLSENGLDIEASDDEKYSFVICVSKGEIEYEGIKDWIIINLKK
ncbi:type II toxin-antitoxin system death-on-curing family toxin [Arenibacter sp. GZD96]|uniref:type II toxin-antitoxin system death-on-curing family toxin n=1 Tax=Aurantibrevibacter litoralis TaxID=3106030 RepID=UPI002AFE2194|nr:type II toxin-antitoxin system death-on-curing family toxin [Arenibacter sp. GZD-96]MEA1785920.1 type II toxin-antitoxin system death-on-curing family toxin [Arenibacter sp. GZD-96]